MHRCLFLLQPYGFRIFYRIKKWPELKRERNFRKEIFGAPHFTPLVATRWKSNFVERLALPRPNTTGSSHFTFGSHKDDVLRIQGTPTKVDATIDWWYYGRSRVMFDDSDRVEGWADSDNNLKVR